MLTAALGNEYRLSLHVIYPRYHSGHPMAPEAVICFLPAILESTFPLEDRRCFGVHVLKYITVSPTSFFSVTESQCLSLIFFLATFHFGCRLTFDPWKTPQAAERMDVGMGGTGTTLLV
jgi:hypothetical protein